MIKRIIGGTALVALAGTAAFVPTAAQNCPSVESLKSYRPPEATRVFALDGSRIADLSPERRVVVSYEQIPRIVREGFVAVEDRRFWEHDGVDVRGVGRAILNNLRALALEEGFSTITMQLTRNVFPSELPRADRFRRKMCEVRLAGQVEDALGKREILTMYANQVYMGDGLYGVEEAARALFGEPAARVSVAQAALLVGLVKNPEGYHPRKHSARAIRRRNVVLDVFAREGVITPAEAEVAKAEPLRLAPPIEAAGPAPYVVAAVRDALREQFGDNADTRGLRVYTAIEPALQKAAHAALVTQIERIEGGTYGRYTHERPEPGRKLTPATGNGSPYLQGMIIVLDVHSGAVRALVGGRDFTHSSFDRALRARRQPGSAFKPILFAAALQAGIAAADHIDATPVSVTQAAGTWQPDDLAPDSLAQLSLRDALALSSNNAAVRVGLRVGPQRVIETARALGITTPIPPYPAITLGAAEVIPAEFVAAFATLGNGGMRVTPTLITRIEDAHGTVLWRAADARARAVDEDVAYITTSMMEDVIDRGTGAIVREHGFWLPAAGKTGTTNDGKDVWFVGMTPDLAAGVWLGFDRPATIAPWAYGGRLAAPVWAELMKQAYTSRPAPAGWLPPPSVVQVPMDVASGYTATRNCPPENVRIEYFRAGSEPGESCPLHPERALDKLIRGLRKIF
jgi:penicillin-binding protein 1A